MASSLKLSALERQKLSGLKGDTPGAAFGDWTACFSAAETDGRRISRAGGKGFPLGWNVGDNLLLFSLLDLCPVARCLCLVIGLPARERGGFCCPFFQPR